MLAVRRPAKWQASEINTIIVSLPEWERMTSPGRFGEYGMQRGFQRCKHSDVYKDVTNKPYEPDFQQLTKQYKTYEQQTIWNIVDCHTEPEQQSVIKKIYKENKTFKEISQENKISVDEVRKLKETGLKKLRSPKAIKEIREKLEMLEESSIMYQSGINSFNNKGMSNTEYLAIKKATLRKFLE